MKTLIKTLALTGALATAVGGGFVVGQAYADQPHMQNALSALHQARDELRRADRNKGGHRQRAMRLVDQAIDEVQAGMAYGGSNW